MFQAHSRFVFTKIISRQRTLQRQKGSSDFFGQSACSVFCLSFALVISCWQRNVYNKHQMFNWASRMNLCSLSYKSHCSGECETLCIRVWIRNPLTLTPPFVIAVAAPQTSYTSVIQISPGIIDVQCLSFWEKMRRNSFASSCISELWHPPHQYGSFLVWCHVETSTK